MIRQGGSSWPEIGARRTPAFPGSSYHADALYGHLGTPARFPMPLRLGMVGSAASTRTIRAEGLDRACAHSGVILELVRILAVAEVRLR